MIAFSRVQFGHVVLYLDRFLTTVYPRWTTSPEIGKTADMGRKVLYLTEAELRLNILDAAAKYCALSGMAWTMLGLEALHDPGFLGRVEAGRNVTFRTYEKFMTWLDRHWPDDVEVGGPPTPGDNRERLLEDESCPS